ncbi:MAG TPA: hypothetical protein VH165_20440 [Kofleriaceae bacterium]|nr:hypothetical protein [Kofleriaceae bacterium]
MPCRSSATGSSDELGAAVEPQTRPPLAEGSGWQLAHTLRHEPAHTPPATEPATRPESSPAWEGEDWDDTRVYCVEHNNLSTLAMSAMPPGSRPPTAPTAHSISRDDIRTAAELPSARRLPHGSTASPLLRRSVMHMEPLGPTADPAASEIMLDEPVALGARDLAAGGAPAEPEPERDGPTPPYVAALERSLTELAIPEIQAVPQYIPPAPPIANRPMVLPAPMFPRGSGPASFTAGALGADGFAPAVARFEFSARRELFAAGRDVPHIPPTRVSPVTAHLLWAMAHIHPRYLLAAGVLLIVLAALYDLARVIF